MLWHILIPTTALLLYLFELKKKKIDVTSVLDDALRPKDTEYTNEARGLNRSDTNRTKKTKFRDVRLMDEKDSTRYDPACPLFESNPEYLARQRQLEGEFQSYPLIPGTDPMDEFRYHTKPPHSVNYHFNLTQA